MGETGTTVYRGRRGITKLAPNNFTRVSRNWPKMAVNHGPWGEREEERTDIPFSFLTGILSPVSMDSFTVLLPDITVPSTGTLPPGRI